MKFSEIKLPSNRKFGFFFSTIFLLVSFYSYFIGSEIMVYLLGTICGILLIITIINADILFPRNKLWMKFGILLGKIVSPIIMGIIFFVIVTPTSLIMKVIGKNLLNLKRDNKKTYWIEEAKIKSKMKNQF